MPKSSPLAGQSTMLRRLLIGLGVLVVVALLAGLTARLAGGDHHTPSAANSASSPTASATSTVSPLDPGPAPSAGATPGPSVVAAPPHTSDPIKFATAFATALWSYDTRTATQPQQLAGLRGWLTGESKYADPDALAAQLPDPVLWSRMRDNGQHAVGEAAEAHLPAAWQQAIGKDPTQLTVAYVYAVTVTGKQTVSWNDGGRGAEDRSLTLAVQCRPGRDCALASIATTVYP
ncbi:hypothetical protein [Kitasatospora griseola]|uniref:hypothetical protein n=1 Tax=Kitasatospora griseola TaxID=2064 RepID=UPI00166F83D6|nr:hypothetical protein [Kitasatospora griseola]GGR05959.1 hypothetical protein GCM10010195_71460 [Kitasatospora griseola]